MPWPCRMPPDAKEAPRERGREWAASMPPRGGSRGFPEGAGLKCGGGSGLPLGPAGNHRAVPDGSQSRAGAGGARSCPALSPAAGCSCPIPPSGSPLRQQESQGVVLISMRSPAVTVKGVSLTLSSSPLIAAT